MQKSILLLTNATAKQAVNSILNQAKDIIPHSSIGTLCITQRKDNNITFTRQQLATTNKVIVVIDPHSADVSLVKGYINSFKKEFGANVAFTTLGQKYTGKYPQEVSVLKDWFELKNQYFKLN